jgi:hypothetical protein
VGGGIGKVSFQTGVIVHDMPGLAGSSRPLCLVVGAEDGRLVVGFWGSLCVVALQDLDSLGVAMVTTLVVALASRLYSTYTVPNCISPHLLISDGASPAIPMVESTLPPRLCRCY